jgi:hypothetical protein
LWSCGVESLWFKRALRLPCPLILSGRPGYRYRINRRGDNAQHQPGFSDSTPASTVLRTISAPCVMRMACSTSKNSLRSSGHRPSDVLAVWLPLWYGTCNHSLTIQANHGQFLSLMASYLQSHLRCCLHSSGSRLALWGCPARVLQS